MLTASLPPSPADSGVSVSDHETSDDNKVKGTSRIAPPVVVVVYSVVAAAVGMYLQWADRLY